MPSANQDLWIIYKLVAKAYSNVWVINPVNSFHKSKTKQGWNWEGGAVWVEMVGPSPLILETNCEGTEGIILFAKAKTRLFCIATQKQSIN